MNIEDEYRSLHDLVFKRYGFYSQAAERFSVMPFRGTAITIDDFNHRHGFNFESVSHSDSEDDLLSLCEYAYNFAMCMPGSDCYSCVWELVEHVRKLAEKMSHRFVDDDGLYVLVPIDSRVLAAAEVAPKSAAADLIRYDYRGLKGNIEGKRSILSGLCLAIESKRGELKALSRNLENDLFFMANNLNIRHNNVDSSDVGKYNEQVAEMALDRLEGLYDALHDMCAAAFLLLEYREHAEEIASIKG